MNLAFFKELFSSQSVTALCWTLFHSLWQGLIFAIIAGILIMLTRRSKPAFRYNALSALFALLVVTTIATFFYERQRSEPIHIQQASESHSAKITTVYRQTSAVADTDEKFSPALLLSNFFSQYAYLIVAVWFFILCAKSVRIVFTLLYTRHLRKHKSHIPALNWRKEIALLCHQLKISKPVSLLESEIIRLPVVFGQLKPIIFIPLGLLSNLAPEQVEAILVHELAHIRRNDYLVNLVQNMVEVLFFFNPSILWISSLIRDERESCCDDMAIAQTGNKKRYVEALISFKQLSLYNNSKGAVAFPGNKRSFINRVSRIVQNRNYTLSLFEKGSLLSCCVIATLLVLAFAHPIQSHRLTNIAVSDTISKPIASIPPPPGPRLRTADSLPLFGEKFDEHHAKPSRTLVTDTLLIHRLPVDTLPMQGNPSLVHSYASALEAMRQVITDLVSEKVVNDTAAVLSFALLDTELVVNHQRQPEVLHQRLKAKYGIHAGFGWYYGPVNMQGKGLWIDLTEGKPALRPPQPFLPDPPPQRPQWDDRPSNPGPTFLRLLDGVINDLVGENVVKDRNTLTSFHLTNQFLIVNGQKQPDDIQETLREKYLADPPAFIERRRIKDPNFGIHYNRETGSMGIGVSNNIVEPKQQTPAMHDL
jgi:beta-lactamase regulating signal transducer with metallopeptidase domain